MNQGCETVRTRRWAEQPDQPQRGKHGTTSDLLTSTAVPLGTIQCLLLEPWRLHERDDVGSLVAPGISAEICRQIECWRCPRRRRTRRAGRRAISAARRSGGRRRCEPTGGNPGSPASAVGDTKGRGPAGGRGLSLFGCRLSSVMRPPMGQLPECTGWLPVAWRARCPSPSACHPSRRCPLWTTSRWRRWCRK